MLRVLLCCAVNQHAALLVSVWAAAARMALCIAVTVLQQLAVAVCCTAAMYLEQLDSVAQHADVPNQAGSGSIRQEVASWPLHVGACPGAHYTAGLSLVLPGRRLFCQAVNCTAWLVIVLPGC